MNHLKREETRHHVITVDGIRSNCEVAVGAGEAHLAHDGTLGGYVSCVGMKYSPDKVCVRSAAFGWNAQQGADARRDALVPLVIGPMRVEVLDDEVSPARVELTAGLYDGVHDGDAFCTARRGVAKQFGRRLMAANANQRIHCCAAQLGVRPGCHQ